MNIFKRKVIQTILTVNAGLVLIGHFTALYGDVDSGELEQVLVKTYSRNSSYILYNESNIPISFADTPTVGDFSLFPNDREAKFVNGKLPVVHYISEDEMEGGYIDINTRKFTSVAKGLIVFPQPFSSGHAVVQIQSKDNVVQQLIIDQNLKVTGIIPKDIYLKLGRNPLWKIARKNPKDPNQLWHVGADHDYFKYGRLLGYKQTGTPESIKEDVFVLDTTGQTINLSVPFQIDPCKSDFNACYYIPDSVTNFEDGRLLVRPRFYEIHDPTNWSTLLTNIPAAYLNIDGKIDLKLYPESENVRYINQLGLDSFSEGIAPVKLWYDHLQFFKNLLGQNIPLKLPQDLAHQSCEITERLGEMSNGISIAHYRCKNSSKPTRDSFFSEYIGFINPQGDVVTEFDSTSDDGFIGRSVNIDPLFIKNAYSLFYPVPIFYRSNQNNDPNNDMPAPAQIKLIALPKYESQLYVLNKKETLPTFKEDLLMLYNLQYNIIDRGGPVIPAEEVSRLGFVDKNGNFIVKFSEGWLSVRPFSEGLSPVLVKSSPTNLWGMIDKSGELKIPANYINISPMSEGLAVATKALEDGYVKCVTIDENGIESDLF